MNGFVIVVSMAVLSTMTIGSPVSGDSCLRCVDMVETFQNLSPTMSQSVSNLCGAFEEEGERKACRDSVREYSEIAPRDLCYKMSQCSQPLNDPDKLQFQDPLQVAKVEEQLTEENDNSMVCSVCEVGIGFLGRYVNGKHAERVLMRLLRFGCHYVPFMGRTCFALVKEYGPLLVGLLREFVQPGFCQAMFGCPEMRLQQVSAESPCRTCELGTDFMFYTVHDKTLKKGFELLAQYGCVSAPNPYECLTESQEMNSALSLAADSFPVDAELKQFCKESEVCL